VRGLAVGDERGPAPLHTPAGSSPKLYTLHPTPYTLSTPDTRHPKQQVRNTKHQTQNTKPQTPNQKPESPNHKPEDRRPKRGSLTRWWFSRPSKLMVKPSELLCRLTPWRDVVTRWWCSRRWSRGGSIRTSRFFSSSSLLSLQVLEGP